MTEISSGVKGWAFERKGMFLTNSFERCSASIALPVLMNFVPEVAGVPL